jgi:hypothetical protein
MTIVKDAESSLVEIDLGDRARGSARANPVSGKLTHLAVNMFAGVFLHVTSRLRRRKR